MTDGSPKPLHPRKKFRESRSPGNDRKARSPRRPAGSRPSGPEFAAGLPSPDCLRYFVGFLSAGIGGLWWVLNGDRQWTAPALTLASVMCPIAVFYTVTNILIGKPGQMESSDPLMPFLVTGGAFGFTLAAMLIPLLSEFDIAVGRTSAIGE